jgi:hypothetical protein
MSFWLVSDLNSAELATFAHMMAASPTPAGATR